MNRWIAAARHYGSAFGPIAKLRLVQDRSGCPARRCRVSVHLSLSLMRDEATKQFYLPPVNLKGRSLPIASPPLHLQGHERFFGKTVCGFHCMWAIYCRIDEPSFLYVQRESPL